MNHFCKKFPPGHSSETLDSQEHQLIEVSSEESQASPKKPVSAGTWIDSTAMVVCRFVDSKVEKATMSEGPNGFAIAAFGENKFESEIPNESLKIYRQSAGGKRPAAVLKRPAAVLKRPAAILKSPLHVKQYLALLKKRMLKLGQLLQLLILNLLLLTWHLLNIAWKIMLPKAVESMVL